MLVDLAWRACDLNVFYTDAGVLPRSSLRQLAPSLLSSAPSLSLHALSGGAPWQWLLFALAAACAVGLAVGYRTRVMTIATWALLTSLHARMPLVLYRGDAVLRLMLFFAMWLPLGGRFGIDARRRGAPGSVSVAGAACFAVTTQLAIVYFAGLAHKRGATWREGSALYYALQLDEYVTPLGRWLGERPTWSPALTYGTLALELAPPLLLFVPWQRSILRMVAVVSAVLLHVGMLLTMRLDLFPWIMFASWVLFLPAPFWDFFARLPRRASSVATGRAHDRRWGPFIGAVLVAIVAWNVEDVSNEPHGSLGIVLRPLGLVQRWSMFAPDPARDDGWLVAAARLEDGSEVDLLDDGRPPTSERPRRSARDLRWRSYFTLVARDMNGELAPDLVAWLCSRAPIAKSLSLVLESERTMPPGEPPLRESFVLSSASCASRRD